MTQNKQPKNVGEFPYPLADGPKESEYLTWLRNHSNYMAERGFLDYVRIVAVLLRGILINILVLLPYLLAVSFVLGLAYKPLLDDWDDQVRPGREDSSIEFFATKEVTKRSGWPKSLQDWLYQGTTDLSVAGTWSAGDTLTTKLANEDGSTESVVTTVGANTTNAEDVRDPHLSDLNEATGLFDKVKWEPSGTDKIVATDAESGKPVFNISVAETADSGTFTFTFTPPSPSTPFLVTPIVLALAAVVVLFFPIVARLLKVVGYKKTLETGSYSSVKLRYFFERLFGSSVKRRDLFERLFGGLLLAILAVVLVESFPLLVHFFHQLRGGDVGWAFPSVAGAVGVLVAANKLLPLLGGRMRKLAVLFVGALGLLIPLLVILFVVEFIVYAGEYTGILKGVLFSLSGVFALGVSLTMILGFRSFGLKGYRKLLLLVIELVGLAILMPLAFLFTPSGYENFSFVLAWAVVIWIFCSLVVDVNLTSIHGLYRDRLASAYLVGVDSGGDVDIEQDIDLQEICNYEARSTAPYHLVNVTLNLQGSKDIAIRERNSDFFIFSKKFIGSERTGYCHSENMEQVYPRIDLGTAMAISAAAASPNMGRGTSPLMVAFMTLLNARLGFWIPHPDRLEKYLSVEKKKDGAVDPEKKELDFAEHVFPEELKEINLRRGQVYKSNEPRPIDDKKAKPTTEHNLVGIGFSGGGIRSATINLGIAQAFHKRGVFDHIDYMSTVSGGGYLGSSISTLMRYKTKPFSEIDGIVSVEETSERERLVRVKGPNPEDVREYRYSNYAELDKKIKDLAEVEAGQRLLLRSRQSGQPHVSLMDRFEWRVRHGALWREMMSMLDENHKWVNLSDGGHIENLAAIELLRRRCKYIIIGDGEADPNLHFNGLATLIRYARIDLGIDIDINPDSIRLDKSKAAVDKGEGNLSIEHWAVGKITYPTINENENENEKETENETGYLLYLKSSYTGDEDEVIEEYRHRNPDFPHESTADQFFDENQFEAYRALGQHIAEQALPPAPDPSDRKLSFSEMDKWFAVLWSEAERKKKAEERNAADSK